MRLTKNVSYRELFIAQYEVFVISFHAIAAQSHKTSSNSMNNVTCSMWFDVNFLGSRLLKVW